MCHLNIYSEISMYIDLRPKHASQTVDQTHDFLENLDNSYNTARGTTPPTSLYKTIHDFMNTKYGANSYYLDSL